MTAINSNRPVYAAVVALETADKKDVKARASLFMAMRDAGANETTLAKDGGLFADLKEGVIVGWQGKAFLADLEKDTDGKRMIAGKIVDQFTGKVSTVKQDRTAWVRAIGSKVNKARNAYLKWATGPVDPASNPNAGQGKAREINLRVTEDLGKLFKAVTKDKEAEAPALKCDHGELLAAFQRALDLVAGKKVDSRTMEAPAKRTKK